MEIQIKKTIKAGNSSAVILPKTWLNKEVRVELFKKTQNIILSDTIDILRKYIEINNVIGIYLVGSYARKEEDENSDIDILVVTKDIDKEVIKEGIYSILIISSILLKQKLKQDLLPIGPMFREAKPLLNAGYLESIEINVTKRNVKRYIKTTEEKLELIKKVLDKKKIQNRKNVEDVVAYTLILRIRTLYLITKLIKTEEYSKKDFVNMLIGISNGKNAYDSYLAVKNNLDEKGVSINEVKKLYSYLMNQLERVKKLLKN